MNPDGNEIWTATYNGPADGQDIAESIALGPDGNFIVVGQIRNSGENADAWIDKYDPDGNPLWEEPIIHNGLANGNDVAHAITFDLGGNFYVTGSEAVAPGNSRTSDMWIEKYRPDGTSVWQISYNGPGNADDAGTDIVLGPDGYLYVTGYETGLISGANILIHKYDLDGNRIWNVTHTGELTNGYDSGASIAFDPDGMLYVGGSEEHIEQSYNVWINKYNPVDGVPIWTDPIIYDGPVSGEDGAGAIAFDLAGSLIVSGLATFLGEGQNSWTRKYYCAGP